MCSAATMRAVVLHSPGGPEMLKIEHGPIPQPLPGEVLIRIEPFGLNRSELFTRRGHSPNVVLPRVLGTVAAAPTAIFAKATRLRPWWAGWRARLMGAMQTIPAYRRARCPLFIRGCLGRSLARCPRCFRPPGAPCSGACDLNPANDCSSAAERRRLGWPPRRLPGHMGGAGRFDVAASGKRGYGARGRRRLLLPR
jgi:hypothetical protein